jgi:hypothetical protein
VHTEKKATEETEKTTSVERIDRDDEVASKVELESFVQHSFIH